jgi:hypothetical protein
MFNGCKLLLVLVCQVLSVTPDFYVQTLDQDIGVFGGCNGLVLDSSGYPHISYNRAIGIDLLYTYFDGIDWNSEFVDTNGNIGNSNDIALDQLGKPHIVYTDSTNSSMKYAFKDDSGWHISTIAYCGSSYQPSIAIDQNNHVHVAYMRQSPDIVYYAYYDGSSWSVSQVDTCSDYDLDGCSIALDNNGVPCIVYCIQNQSLIYARYQEGNWVKTNLTSDAYSSYLHSLRFDTQNRPWIVFSVVTNDNLKYAHQDGTEWIIEDLGTRCVVNMGHYIDKNDNKHIVYNYNVGYPNNRMTYLKCIDGNWQSTDLLTGESAIFISLGVNSYSVPYISWIYQYSSLGYLMFGWYGNENLGVDSYNFKAEPVYSDAVLLTWQTPPDISSQPLGYYLYKQKIGEKVNDKWVLINNELISGDQNFKYRDDDVVYSSAYQYKLYALFAEGIKVNVANTNCTVPRKKTAFTINRIYPNPTNNRLNIELLSEVDMPIDATIFDISGKLILSESHIPAGNVCSISFDVSKLKQGVYVVIVSSGKDSGSRYFIVSQKE